MVNRLAPPENTVFIVPNVNLLDFLYHLMENKKVIAWEYKVMAQRRKEHQRNGMERPVRVTFSIPFLYPLLIQFLSHLDRTQGPMPATHPSYPIWGRV